MKRSIDAEKVRQWTRRLKQFRNSKLTVAEFCRREGVSVPSFYQWKKRLGLESKTAKAATRSAQPRSKLVPVQNGDVHCFRPIDLVSPQSAARGVTVRIPGGIEIDLGNDPSVIGQVVGQLLDHQAVRGERC